MAPPEKFILSLRARRGHVTRAYNETVLALNFANSNLAQKSLESLERFFELYLKRVEDYEEYNQEIQDEKCETEDEIKKFEVELTEILDNRRKLSSKVLKVLQAGLPAPRAPAAPAAAAAAPAAGGRPKIVDALKPFILKADSPPSDLTNWLEKYKTYASASRFDLYAAAEQQNFFFGCMNLTLETKIRENDHFRNDLPVLLAPGAPDCLERILNEEFEIKHPLFNRRFKLFSMSQSHGQAFSDYFLKMQQLASECQLATLETESLLVFRILTSVSDKTLRDRFFKLDNPSLADLKTEFKAYEAGLSAARLLDRETHARVVQQATPSPMPPQQSQSQQQKGVRNPRDNAPQNSQVAGPGHQAGAAVVAAAAAPRYQPRTAYKANYRDKESRDLDRNSAVRIPIPVEIRGRCFRCGSDKHLIQECNLPTTLTCNRCQRRGHTKNGFCYKKFNISVPRSNLRAVQDEAPEFEFYYDDQDLLFQCRGATEVVNVTVSKPTPKISLTFCKAGGGKFSFEVTPDSGATRTVMARNLADKFSVKINKSNAKLKNASDKYMKVDGEACFRVLGHEVSVLISPEVVDEILLSWHDQIALGILPPNFPSLPEKIASVDLDAFTILKEKLAAAFPDVLCDQLDPNSSMVGPPMKIHLKDNMPIKPTRLLQARKIPLHIQAASDRCLAALIKAGVLAKVDEPTPWVSAGHFVPKPNGEARLVVDMVNLNKYVKRPVHPFPTGMDIIHNLDPKSRVFAKLDAVSGYHQIKLDKESSLLTTFLLPQGRYSFLRAPMGLNASGDEWCARSDQAFQSLPKWFKKLVDDILVEAPTLEILEHRLFEILTLARAVKMRLSLRKFEIGESVHFAGHIVSGLGTYADPEKLEGITKFPAPKSTTDIKSFLGMANQLSNFHPDLSHMTVNIRGLLKKSNAFVWLSEHQKEFEDAKKFLCSPAFIKPFDPDLQSFLLTDASRKRGLGFCLLQKERDGNNRIICCGSCSLTPTQQRYATIELECLGVLWALNKCKFWVQGIEADKLCVVVDHKPLIGLFSKLLSEVDNPRLQRMREKMAGFAFQIEWGAGKNHQIADALSRYPVWDGADDDSSAVNQIRSRIARLVDRSKETSPELRFLLKEAAACENYKAIVSAIKDDKQPKNLPPNHPARLYQDVWSRLSLFGNDVGTLILLDCDRIVVPESCIGGILKLLHIGHLGVVKTKLLAKRFYYWKNMSQSIETLVNGCRYCTQLLPSQSQEPFVDPSMPKQPMDEVGCDLFEACGRHFVLLVDRLSGFPLVKEIKRQTSEAVISALLPWFHLFGFCAKIRTDGGPCFDSKEFRDFCQDHNIIHELSSAYNAPSNGLAEAHVKICKHLFIKCHLSGESYGKALSEFRLAPRANGFSPADLFFKRCPRGHLPGIRPEVDPAAGREARKNTISAAADLHEGQRELAQLEIGDAVIIQDPKSKFWNRQGVISEVRDFGRSYVVISDGWRLLRNRRFLRLNRTRSELANEAEIRFKSDPRPVQRRSPRLESKPAVSYAQVVKSNLPPQSWDFSYFPNKCVFAQSKPDSNASDAEYFAEIDRNQPCYRTLFNIEFHQELARINLKRQWDQIKAQRRRTTRSIRWNYTGQPLESSSAPSSPPAPWP